jgi:6,7-dimethyl-8-ribityllumazine synthase
VRTLARSGELPPPLDGRNLTVAFVVATFHADLSEAMLHRAQDRAKASGCKLGPVLRVQGSFDVGLPTEWLLEQEQVDCVVVIGAIVKGETQHDEVIAHATASTLQALSVEYDKPVGFAITGPGMTMDQAKARVGAGAVAVDACLRVVEAWRQIND